MIWQYFAEKTATKRLQLWGEGVAELSTLEPVIDSCPDKNYTIAILVENS